MKGHRGCVDSVTATSDGTHVVSGGDDGMVRIWDAVAGSAAAEPSEYDGVKLGFGGSECRRVAYIFGGSEGLVRVWDEASGTVVSRGKLTIMRCLPSRLARTALSSCRTAGMAGGPNLGRNDERVRALDHGWSPARVSRASRYRHVQFHGETFSSRVYGQKSWFQ
jgi:WD40 repeat protein